MVYDDGCDYDDVKSLRHGCDVICCPGKLDVIADAVARWKRPLNVMKSIEVDAKCEKGTNNQ